MRIALALWLSFAVGMCCRNESWAQKENPQKVSKKQPTAVPALAVAPFDASRARALQKLWADHLALPVESTNSIGMKLVVIPTGEFHMGSLKTEPGRNDNERYRRVKLTKPFFIGATEVTQAQYEAVVGMNPSSFKGANRPVNLVDWNEAVEYCRKLSELPAEKAAGRVYRLPRDDEWEFACRAGTTTIYSFGDDAGQADKFAWFKENSGKESHPVAEKLPNDWGLFDMHGNIFEWCEIEPAGDHRFLTANSKGLYETYGQVYRGGSWINKENYIRSATRNIYQPTLRQEYLGFRVACDCPVR